MSLPKKSTISSPAILLNRPKSSKSVQLICEPVEVRYFNSKKSITRDASFNSMTFSGYQSSLSSSAVDLDLMKCGDSNFSEKIFSSVEDYRSATGM